MITQQEKDGFLQELKALVESNFTALDVCCFIRDNDMAHHLLRQYSDYDKELNFLNNHSTGDIENVLNTPHMEYYDSDYGSLDPLCGMRMASKEEYEEDGDKLLLEDFYNYDNVISHMLLSLEEEDIEIPQSEILCRDSLERLIDGGYDFPAKQIYYFECIGFDSYCFWHCWKDDKGWDCKQWNIDFNNFEGLARDFFEGYDDEYDIECHFYYDIETSYLEELDRREEYIPLSKAVFNGIEAITQLKQNTIGFLRSMAQSYIKLLNKKEEEHRDKIIDEIECCDAALSFLDMPIKVIADHLVIEKTNGKEQPKGILTTEKFKAIDKLLKENKCLKRKLSRIFNELNS